MRFVDAFAGIGGFHYAMKETVPESQCVMAIESDVHASNNYLENHGVKPFGDIRTLDINAIPEFDLLIGGFPCQPFSRNGQVYNFDHSTLLDDDRALLVDYLLEILLIKKPEYFLFENVKGIKTISNGMVYDYICNMVMELGYKLNVFEVDSADFGVPQQRKRIVFAGTKQGNIGCVNTIPRASCVRDIMDNEVDPKYYIEHLWRNRKVMLQRPDKANHSQGKGRPRLNVFYELLESARFPCGRTHKITPLAIVYGETPSGTARQQDKLYSSLGISPTLATFATPCFDDGNDNYRVLTPRECARLQGFPETHVLPERDSLGYKQLGNSITINVMSEILKALLE